MSNTDFDPDAFLSGVPSTSPPSVSTSAPASAPVVAHADNSGFDPDAFLANKAPSGNMFSDVWPEIKSAAASAAGTIADTLNPFSEARHAAYAKAVAEPSFMSGLGDVAQQTVDTGKGITAIPELAAAPVTGATRSLLGHPLATASEALGLNIDTNKFKSLIDAGTPEKEAYEQSKLSPNQTYEQWKGNVDTAMIGLRPAGAPVYVPAPAAYTQAPYEISATSPGLGWGTPTNPQPPIPTALTPANRPFGITLSQGEAESDLAKRMAEQNAIRSGDPHARAWYDQRVNEIQQANQDLLKGLDPYGQTIAQTPQEAGELVSQGVQGAATASKAGVDNLYQLARSMPGEIHAAAFEGLPQKIKGDLTLRDEPVFIDENTPNAAKMINYLDNKIGALKITNLADPFGPPNPENIVGVSLKGVDQWRKALSTMRSDAYGSANGADQRATRAVLDSFDDHIDQAVNGGLFNGNPAAVEAWNNARAAYSDYRSTFGGQGTKDPVGRVVNKILGDNINDPITPTKVVDQLVGSTGVSPSSLNIAVVKRIKSILGEQSPQWIAAKQGVLSRLIQTGEGEQGLGTGQVAQRLSKFLNSDIAEHVYSPQELATLRSYANLMRQITMPPGTYFPSAPGIGKYISMASYRVGQLLGAIVGSHIPFIPRIVGEFAGITIGGKLEKAAEAWHNNIRSQLPIVATEMKKWQRAQARAQSAPSWATRQGAVLATNNLQNALSPLGINLRQLQMPGTVGAEPQQDQTKQRADGGTVSDDAAPEENPGVGLSGAAHDLTASNFDRLDAAGSGLNSSSDQIDTVNRPLALRSGIGLVEDANDVAPATAHQRYRAAVTSAPGQVGQDIQQDFHSTPTPVSDQEAVAKDPRSAWDKLTGQGGERYQLWPEKLVRSATTLPGDVATGATPYYLPSVSDDPNSSDFIGNADRFGRVINPDIIARTQDLAGLAGGASLPMAERGALGMAGGALKIPTALETVVADKPRLSADIQHFLTLAQPLEQKYGTNWPTKLNQQELQAIRNNPAYTNAIATIQQAKDSGVFDKVLNTQMTRRDLFGTAARAASMIANASRLGKVLETLPVSEMAEHEYFGVSKDTLDSIKNDMGIDEALQTLGFKPSNISDALWVSEKFPETAIYTAGKEVEDLPNHWRIIDKSELPNAVEEGLNAFDGKYGNGVNSFLKSFVKTQASSIVHSPTKLLSDTGRVGAPLAALEHNQYGLYSPVERAVADAPQAKMQASQWYGWLKNQPGVKQEELDWLGLKDNPDLQGAVTKDQMLEHVQGHGPQLQEVEKGGPELNDKETDRMLYLAALDNEGRLQPGEQAELKTLESKGVNGTKYSSYQLPGGDNYRELLLTMPNSKTELPAGTRARQLAEQGGENWDDLDPNGREHFMDRAQQGEGSSVNFHSSHWGEPNVLAHMRMSDRTIPGVGNSLHLEELQSDWHQKGRRKGYSTKRDPSEFEPVWNKESWWDVRDKTTGKIHEVNPFLVMPGDTNAKARVAAIVADRLSRQGVPDAPFKQTWPDLLLKRAIVKAAQEGKDAISWTPGEQQADRYDLSKHLNSISATNNGDGTFELRGEMPNGNNHKFGSSIPQDDLDKYVGKDIAQKIVDNKTEERYKVESNNNLDNFYIRDTKTGELVPQSGGHTKPPVQHQANKLNHTTTLSGLDLKVGGEGMKAFYDKMLVDKANAIGKKYGAKVEWRDVPVPKKVEGSPNQYVTGYSGSGGFKPVTEKMPVLRLTPKLKEQALSQGLPMFKKGGVVSVSNKDKQSIERPPTQKQDGGKVQQKQEITERAKGGALHLSHPWHPNNLAALRERASGGRVEHHKKIDRSAFLYLKGNNENFAQCGSCSLMSPDNTCVIFNSKVKDEWSCGLYVPGPYKETKSAALVTPEEAGLVKYQVRCENCTYGGKHCQLYTKLNKQFPDLFDLDTKIDSQACCNAFIPHEPIKRAHGGRVEAANVHPSPSPALIKAGNYRKDHVNIFGLNITIENAKGMERKGVGKDGKPWRVVMPAAYGYLKGTEGKDSDHLDVYLGHHKNSPNVYIVDQHDADSKRFDEHKIFLGFGSLRQVVSTYERAFSDNRGLERIGKIAMMTVPEFKHWLEHGDTKKPFEPSWSEKKTLH